MQKVSNDVIFIIYMIRIFLCSKQYLKNSAHREEVGAPVARSSSPAYVLLNGIK